MVLQDEAAKIKAERGGNPQKETAGKKNNQKKAGHEDMTTKAETTACEASSPIHIGPGQKSTSEFQTFEGNAKSGRTLLLSSN